jgi:type IV secretory pathway TraG/TraD family ATPase VirD4
MNDRLGNAKWEDQARVAAQYPFAAGKFWLGRAEDETAIGYRDDRHICLVSGSRGGKGTSIIVNNLCFWPGSAVVIDPKGENATLTAARRGQGSQHCEGMGQLVHVLDPFKAAQMPESYRSSFNPLDALDPTKEESIDEAARLANAIVVVKDERADPFFDESARSMVRGLILHVLTAADFEEHERTLLMVRDLLTRGEWRVAQAMRDLGDGEVDPPHQLLWRAMEMNPAFAGVVAGIGSRFLAMMTSSPKTFESVLQSAAINTEFLDSPGMRRVLEKSDFKLSDLKTRPEGMTLYLSLPQRYMDTHYRWLRMMVALTTTEMEIVRGQPATGHPVLMVLDEFAGLKRMTAIENAVAQIAGFGVKLFFVLQSLEQLKNIYKDNWETFLANAGLKVFFSVEDHFTREYVSKLIGDTELVRELRSSNEGRSETESVAEGRSQSTSTSRSTTRGTSESRTVGTSTSSTVGESRSANESRSDGVNSSRSRTESSGTNEGRNWSQGQSTGVSYKKVPFFFFWEQVDPASISYSNGQNSSVGGSTGTSHGISEGTSEGRSTGTSRGTSFGTSKSGTKGQSESFTKGTSYSETAGTSETTGTSQTSTRGTGRTSGSGTSESLHRRPLLQPDDLGRLFARIDDREHLAYPGFALALITGNDPVVVHRTHYFEDVQFIDTFSPHPDHAFLPPAEEQVQGIGPLLDKLEEAKGGKLTIARWLIRKGEVRKAGDAAAQIEQVPPDNRTVHVRLPVTGKVSYVGAPADELAQPGRYRVPRGVLCKLKHYDGDGQRVDPFVELRAACAALLKPVPEPKPLPQPIRKKSQLWMPRLGAVCVLLSVVLFLLQIWTFFNYFWSRSPVAEVIESKAVYLTVLGFQLLGAILLGRSLKQPDFPARGLTRLLGCCFAVEGVVLVLATWKIGTIASNTASRPLFANVIEFWQIMYPVLWPTVALGLYWLWFCRETSRRTRTESR